MSQPYAFLTAPSDGGISSGQGGFGLGVAHIALALETGVVEFCPADAAPDADAACRSPTSVLVHRANTAFGAHLHLRGGSHESWRLNSRSSRRHPASSPARRCHNAVTIKELSLSRFKGDREYTKKSIRKITRINLVFYLRYTGIYNTGLFYILIHNSF